MASSLNKSRGGKAPKAVTVKPGTNMAKLNQPSKANSSNRTQGDNPYGGKAGTAGVRKQTIKKKY
jgi:hypothetical protein